MMYTRIRGYADLIIFLVIAALGIGQTHAASIVGGSALMTASQANQIEAWIGTGPKTFTNIYEKQTGDTAAQFHAAADNKGPTIVVMEATVGSDTKIIGGYNPVSWNCGLNNYVYSPLNNRKAFLINLTQGYQSLQKNTSEQYYYEYHYDCSCWRNSWPSGYWVYQTCYSGSWYTVDYG